MNELDGYVYIDSAIMQVMHISPNAHKNRSQFSDQKTFCRRLLNANWPFIILSKQTKKSKQGLCSFIHIVALIVTKRNGCQTNKPARTEDYCLLHPSWGFKPCSIRAGPSFHWLTSFFDDWIITLEKIFFINSTTRSRRIPTHWVSSRVCFLKN